MLPLALLLPSLLETLLAQLTPTTTFQTVEGFGGTLTDAAALNIRNVLETCGSDNSLTNAVMKSLFDPNGGKISANIIFLIALWERLFRRGFQSYSNTNRQQ